ncbi:MAG: FHA domain-containing protein [Cystobacterineae bacterium]|nr:FHA domain-containing protein [Cystobacterineae bacterium]
MPQVKKPSVTIRVVRADGGTENVYPMKTDVLLCGRTSELSLPDDPFIADVQIRFFFSGGRLAIEDIGGGNGVFTRLRQEREIAPGSEVRAGRQRLLVEAIPPLAPNADGTTAWGSPDIGFRFRLVQILEGGIRGAVFPLKIGDNNLGREAGDIYFLNDGFISGRHAVISASPEKLTIRDVGSSNGTFLRLAAPAFVENGDQFLLGRQLMRVDIQN